MRDVDGLSGRPYDFGSAYWPVVAIRLGRLALSFCESPVNRLRTTLLNYLLSSLVMAWGMLPPALVHAHEGGDQAGHRHAAPVGLADEHSHDDGSHGCQHSHHEDGFQISPELGGIVAHAHWELFGVDFSWPVPDEGNHEGNSRSVEPVLVRLANEPVPVTVTSVIHSGLIGATALQPALDVVRSASAPTRAANPVAALPLCDSARLERSGVLRA